MSTKDNTYYEEFAAEIESGDFEIDKKNIQRGTNLGLDLVLAATGTESEEEALAMFAPGRPALGQERGISPSIRARVPQELKESVISLARKQGKKESEIVRLAVAEYIKTHAA